jgi:hypothetical protein
MLTPNRMLCNDFGARRWELGGLLEDRGLSPAAWAVRHRVEPSARGALADVFAAGAQTGIGSGVLKNLLSRPTSDSSDSDNVQTVLDLRSSSALTRLEPAS